MSKTTRTRALVAGAVTTAVALAGAGYGIANAAAQERPALEFRVATPNVTAERYVEDEYVWFDFDLGVHLIAGNEPFEIRAQRRNYAQPIKAQRIVTAADGTRTAVDMPAGLVDSFSGFRDFTAITIRDAAGATVTEYQTDFCPNTWGSSRTRPDAPSHNPYPEGCAGGNPFTLGAVWGIQAGWNATTESMPRWNGDEPEFDLAPGTYTATITLNPTYRDYFAIPADKATATVNVTVVNTGPGAGGEGLARAKALTRAAGVGVTLNEKTAALGEHGEHAGQGDASLQVAGYRPEFRPPAKAPKTLAATPRKGPKPDLRSLPAWGISVQSEDGKDYVAFGATVWNAGTSPLLVDGFRRTGPNAGDTELMDAYQYFFDAAGNEVGSVNAGTMEWDPREGHRHWHFTDFAQYNLLNADKSLAVRSGKESFCLANTDAVDYTIPNAKWRPANTDLSSSCGQNTAVAVREVLDIGNGDTYTQDRPGQSFEITDLPNGTYWIETLANPDHKLAELNLDNNSAVRKIVLGGKPGARTLRVPAVHGIEG